MDAASQKVKEWILAGKDPRTAHWQAGLEAMMNIFDPLLEPGRLSPVQPLEAVDLPIFKAVVETADLSPSLKAAFLPPALAAKIQPPASAEALDRIDPEKPSYKILVQRSGPGDRILCAEISPFAKKAGADLFQSGGLLGTYDYASHEECIGGLTLVLRAHLWQKGKWSPEEHRRYTEIWFEKVLDLESKTVRVEPNFSYLHHPSLIKADRIEAVFTLIQEVFRRGFGDPHGGLLEGLRPLLGLEDPGEKEARLSEWVESYILKGLQVLRDFELVPFREFSDQESRGFATEFSKTVQRMIRIIENLEKG